MIVGLTALPRKDSYVTETYTQAYQTVTRSAAFEANSMTSMVQSRKERCRPMGSIVTPKNHIMIGCWNVRTMIEISKTAQVANEMRGYGIEILGLSETRWKGIGELKLQSGETIMYSGNNDVYQGGVAIMVSSTARRTMLEWTPISERIIKARFYSRHKKLTIIQAYAPTNEAVDNEKDDFYYQIQDTLKDCNRDDMIVVMGDFNAKVGSNNTNREEVMGKHGVGDMNDNGERLCNFCSMNGLVISGTLFLIKRYTN